MSPTNGYEQGASAAAVIRHLQAEDALWLSVLHAECFDERRRWSMELLKSFLETPAAFGLVYIAGQEPCGFILGQGGGEEAEIVTLATRPAFRRRGIAAMLVGEFSGAYRKQGKNVLFLEVAEDNEAAISLYRKMGFEQCGTRPHYYQEQGSGAHALIMRKSLYE
jgi:[ribosomal protein S18]-alanine N-acetyltransferase